MFFVNLGTIPKGYKQRRQTTMAHCLIRQLKYGPESSLFGVRSLRQHETHAPCPQKAHEV
jgi:hypothetical protein